MLDNPLSPKSNDAAQLVETDVYASQCKVMERLTELAEFWNQLPAFRAVAETEHLKAAAEYLGVGAPALSRSIRLLEERLGTELFVREGRGLKLNEAGRLLLEAARVAMQQLDEAQLTLRGETLAGPVHIASSGVVTTSYLLPAIIVLRASHPTLVPVLSGPPPLDVVARLQRGLLDVAFTSDPIDAPALLRERLGVETSGVYCGRGHPLFERSDVAIDEIAQYDFVGPTTTSGRGSEGWPSAKPRRIGAIVDQMRIGLEFCASGHFLAVLPDALARADGRAERLWRLPVELGTRVELFALLRDSGGRRGRAEVVVEAVRTSIAKSKA